MHERFIWEEGNNVMGNTTMGENALTHCARPMAGGNIASNILCDVEEVDPLVLDRRNIILPSRMKRVS